MTNAQIPHNLRHLSAFPDEVLNAGNPQVVLAFQDSWWARKDLNLGPTDYESAALTS
jgi:hypothetical protein